MKFGLIVVGAVLAVGLFVFLQFIGYSNKEITLRQRVVAQQKSNEAVFDNTWKIIQQQAQVSDAYKESFREIYPALMEGRYGNERGGAFFSWVTESNPNFDTSLYSKLMDSIEAQRTIFTREQQELIDLNREHTTMLAVFPGSLYLAGRSPVEIKVVTSQRTDEAFAAEQDNDVDLGLQ